MKVRNKSALNNIYFFRLLSTTCTTDEKQGGIAGDRAIPDSTISTTDTTAKMNNTN